MLILFETYVFYKGNLDRLSLAIRTAPVFRLSLCFMDKYDTYGYASKK